MPAKARPWLEAAGFFALAWVLRLCFLFSAARAAAISWKDLALMYDGHVYVLIARSAPLFYTRIETYFPAYKNSEYFTGWFPLYPALIAAVDVVLSDLRLSALVASQLSSSAAVAVFYLLARQTVRRPVLATLAFCVFPATWLLAGSLAFVESAYALFFIAAIYFFMLERWKAAAAAAALSIVTQKSGALLLVVFALALWRREGARALRHWPLAAAALAPLALLQLYLWATFGEAWINLRIQREIFGDSFFALPFQAILGGLLSPTQIFDGHFWARKALIAGSCLFYAAVCAWSWRQKRPALEPLLLWLTVVLAFNLCLAGLWGYYSFARFMTVAAPAAILLIADRLPALSRPAVAAAFAALLMASYAAALIDAQDSVALMYEKWPRGYFESLAAHAL